MVAVADAVVGRDHSRTPALTQLLLVIKSNGRKTSVGILIQGFLVDLARKSALK